MFEGRLENNKSLVLQDKCNIEIFLSPAVLSRIARTPFSTVTFLYVLASKIFPIKQSTLGRQYSPTIHQCQTRRNESYFNVTIIIAPIFKFKQLQNDMKVSLDL